MTVQKYVFYLRFEYNLYFIKDKTSCSATSIKNHHPNLSPLHTDLRSGQAQRRATF